MPKTASCIKVPKKQGQKTVELAGKLGLIDRTLEIQRDKTDLYIPMARQLKERELEMLKTKFPQLQLQTKDFTEKKLPPQTISQILRDKVPSNLLMRLPQAFDIVGDIVIIEIPQELKAYEKVIGEAMLKTQKNVHTVLAKAGIVSGVYRVRDYTVIAGEPKTRTIHREFGVQYHVDVGKAYFSPRLSHEHERVASLVGNNETIVDLFSGVGPFSVLIAKKNQTVKVYAVDLNPSAVELLKLNVRVNHVEGRVFPVLGNAREIAATKLKGVADRVIMNLPETAISFVDAACNTIKPEGGVVHFYGFVRSPDSVENLKERLKIEVERSGRQVKAFLFLRSIRETAPYESQVVFDVKVA